MSEGQAKATVSRILRNRHLLYHKPREHNPPHIHASYGEHNATLIIENGQILEGDLPNRALHLVREWMEIHRAELSEMWETDKIGKIKPLD